MHDSNKVDRTALEFVSMNQLDETDIKRRITWYDDPDAAEDDVREHYRQMTPQQRLDEMVGLLNRVGKWNERRLTRVARLIKFGER